MTGRRQIMNEKFFHLPEEKQKRIINAGFRVFAQNSYRKCPVSEIAAEARISKSLLFFYFRNKKELYLFLWQKVEELTRETLAEADLSKQDNIFDMMYESLRVKTALLREYPDIFSFSLRAYYEDDPEVKDEIRSAVLPYTMPDTNLLLRTLDAKDYREGIDLRLMYQNVYLASEAYLWRMYQNRQPDIDKVLKDMKEMTDFWKKLYLKEGETHEPADSNDPYRDQ